MTTASSSTASTSSTAPGVTPVTPFPTPLGQGGTPYVTPLHSCLMPESFTGLGDLKTIYSNSIQPHYSLGGIRLPTIIGLTILLFVCVPTRCTFTLRCQPRNKLISLCWLMPSGKITLPTSISLKLD